MQLPAKVFNYCKYSSFMRSSSRSTTLLPYGWTILWPVFHYQIPDHPKSKAYEDHSWIYYEHVNQAFADKIVKSYKRGDIIWIHSAFEDPPSVSAKSLSDIRIRIKVLHNFSRMRRFQPYSAVVEAVKASEVLELTEDEEVRRKVPLDEKFGNSYDDTNLDSLIFKNTHGRGGHTRPPHRRTVNRRPPWSLATARFKAFRRK
ncbi:Trehalose-6-P synthase/phosphatase complex subunit [Diplodia seriata]|uniref:Trehalose-6-P synthase/phosphatase complex subunit n=1 Tax=Diplodia seriata TaxID=420778 RepID=A0ABR3CQ19_9PEZI